MSPTARRRLSWTALAAGVALAVALTVWWLLGEQDRSRTRSAARAEATEMAPRPGAARVAPPRPRLEIPSIGVSAHAVDLGLERNGTLEVPKRYEQVGLWKNGPEPGRRGPAVIAGHVDSRTAPAVFQRLRELGRVKLRLDRQKEITFLHFLTFFKIHLDQFSADLRFDRDGGNRLH